MGTHTYVRSYQLGTLVPVRYVFIAVFHVFNVFFTAQKLDVVYQRYITTA